MKLIDKNKLLEELKNLKQNLSASPIVVIEDVESLVENLEAKEVDLELITCWFDHIAQIANDRMTLTNQRMTDAHALDEIKCLAKNSSEFITKHYKAQKGE